MNQRKKLTLMTGISLIIGENSLQCYDENHSEIILTRGQELLLKKLAYHANHAVSMSDLYEAYSGNSTSIDDTGIRDNIAKMKNTMPTCIKGSIKSVRGFGYKLVTAPNSQAYMHEDQADTTSKAVDLTGLAGDYYSFFLDPVGNGSILSGYFHIEKPSIPQNQSLSVSAILGIRDNSMLFSHHLAEVFSLSSTDYHKNFREFISSHNVNNKRCFWAEGELQCHNAVAELKLKTPIDARWNIWLDLSHFLERIKHESIYTYKGGLGFAVAATPSYGTFCCKIGLIPTSYCTQPQKLCNPELQSMLMLSGTHDFNPLMLDIRGSRYWYNWFMSDSF